MAKHAVDVSDRLLVHAGAKLGIATPVAQAITDTVREIDNGERTPGVENLALTLQAAGVTVAATESARL